MSRLFEERKKIAEPDLSLATIKRSGAESVAPAGKVKPWKARWVGCSDRASRIEHDPEPLLFFNLYQTVQSDSWYLMLLDKQTRSWDVFTTEKPAIHNNLLIIAYTHGKTRSSHMPNSAPRD